jgi:hypothetical protein
MKKYFMKRRERTVFPTPVSVPRIKKFIYLPAFMSALKKSRPTGVGIESEPCGQNGKYQATIKTIP